MSNDEPSGGSGERSELEWLDLYPLYDAPDEPTAIHVQAFLVGAGFEARIRSAQIPGFDGAYAMAVGYWGQVMVPRRDVIGAKAALERFLAEVARRGEAEAMPGDGTSGAEEPEGAAEDEWGAEG